MPVTNVMRPMIVGHKQAHKKHDIQNAYNKPNNLPIDGGNFAGPSHSSSHSEVDAALADMGIQITDDDIDNFVQIVTSL